MWTTSDIPDQTGRTAVITGANGGLGLATAKALAAKGAHIVMAARNQDKARAAQDEILATTPEASTEIVELDLGSQASVKQAATTILAAHPTIDLLINNAGLMAMPERQTSDGYEMQFGVNHLGHWTLTAGLLAALVATPGSRVVTVSSTAQHTGKPIDPDNPHLRDGAYGPWRAYGQAKLANRHFAEGLQVEFERHGAQTSSLAAHPGLTNSDLQSTTVAENPGNRLGHVFHRMVQATGMDAETGALSQLRAATDPDVPGGGFYGPLWVTTGPPVRKPLVRPGSGAAIRTLWEVSERETGVALDVAAALDADR
ncbi:oxidoreductase [Euzebya tangerina]|uniref:oxidoreductase n=1 Tax=Euzebya tangerina TaxID=591198 RepID=UPI000E323B9A|nr:oxidoreductase [Euzebya tangerina]